MTDLLILVAIFASMSICIFASASFLYRSRHGHKK